MGMNKIIVDGKVYGEPMTRPVNKTKVCTFAVIHTEKGAMGRPDKTHFFKCEGWGDVATELAKLRENDEVTLAGRLIQTEWEKDGKKNSMIKIRVSDVGCKTNHYDETANSTPYSGGSPEPTYSEDPTGEIAF